LVMADEISPDQAASDMEKAEGDEEGGVSDR
jgi:hypothetical protein